MNYPTQTYCKCCTSTNQHIEHHYDPSGVVARTDDATETLAAFRACFPGDPCPLTVEDVAAYIGSR